MRIFYRYSDSGNIRVRVNGATKEKCLSNFFKNFKLGPFDSMFILADGVTDKTWKNLGIITRGNSVTAERSQSGSEAGSFKLLLDEFVKSYLASHDYVYFAEDDYIYVPNA